jgi:hypothetical protein
MSTDWTFTLDFVVLMSVALCGAILASFFCLRLAKQLRTLGWLSGKADPIARSHGSAVLAITVGLCAVSIWAGHQKCQTAQVGMAESLITAYRACAALPETSQHRIRSSFVTFIEQTATLNDELGGIGPDNRFWAPLHQARQEALFASRALSDPRQLFIESRFDDLLKERFSWASSFFYGLHPLLWVTLSGAAFLLLLVTAILEDTNSTSPWATMVIASAPLAFILAACYALSHPLQGMCRVDTSALFKLIPLLQQNLL